MESELNKIRAVCDILTGADFSWKPSRAYLIKYIQKNEHEGEKGGNSYSSNLKYKDEFSLTGDQKFRAQTPRFWTSGKIKVIREKDHTRVPIGSNRLRYAFCQQTISLHTSSQQPATAVRTLAAATSSPRLTISLARRLIIIN